MKQSKKDDSPGARFEPSGIQTSEITKLNLPVIIYHGTNDDVVNPNIVKNIALKYFSNLEHHLVER